MSFRSAVVLVGLLGLACGGVSSDGSVDGVVDLTGAWEEQTQISMAVYDSSGLCVQEGGTWEDGLCLFPNTNSATFTPTGQDGVWTVEIETLGPNAHICTFEGEVRRDGEEGFVASAPSEVFIPGEGGGDGRFEEAECAFPVTVRDDVLSLDGSGEACRSFCGARAYLYLEGARRR